MLRHAGDGLLAAPVVEVDAGVHHQPHRAPHLHFQLAVALVRRFVQAHLDAEGLAVQRPAFDAGGVLHRAVAAEGGQVSRLLQQRQVHQVAGPGFVQRERRVQVARAFGRQATDPENAGRRAVGRAGLGVGRRHVRRYGIGDAVHAVGDARDVAEVGRDAAVDALAKAFDLPAQHLSRRRDELRVGGEEAAVAGHVAGVTGLRGNGLDFAGNARHFGQAERVHLLGGHGRGGEVLHQHAVKLLAVRALGAGQRVARTVGQRPGHERGVLAQRGLQLIGDESQCALGMRPQGLAARHRRALERAKPGRSLGRRAEHAVRVGDGGAKHHARVADAGRVAGGQALAKAAQALGDRGQALDVPRRVGRVRDRRRVGPEHGGEIHRHRKDRRPQVGLHRVLGADAAKLTLQQPVRGKLLPGQRAGVDGLQLDEQLACAGVAARVVQRRLAEQHGVVELGAGQCGRQRHLLALEAPVAFGQRGQCARGRHGGRIRHGCPPASRPGAPAASGFHPRSPAGRLGHNPSLARWPRSRRSARAG